MNLQYFLIWVLAALTISCSSKPTAEDVKIDKEVQAQSSINTQGEVAQRGLETILRSTSLNEDQKQQFKELHKDVSEKTLKIQDESSKLMLVLFETISQKPYERTKVAKLKKRLVALDKQKMRNMFDAMDKVKEILGEKPDQATQDYYRSFFWERDHRGQGI